MEIAESVADTILHFNAFLNRESAPNNRIRLIVDSAAHLSSPCLLQMACQPCTSLEECNALAKDQVRPNL